MFKSPREAVSVHIRQELKNQKYGNWVATLPAVLWALRTLKCRTRGCSPYEIIFEKEANTALDNLFGNRMSQEQFQSVCDYYLAVARRNELAQTYAKRNLAQAILKHRK